MSKTFLAALAMLIVSAVGMQPTIAGLAARFSKGSVEIRKKLTEMDLESLPTFVADPEAQRYEGAEDSLGTDEFMSMAFRFPGDPVTRPTTILFVTYYSDPADQVPHTPEVCFQQGGAQVTNFKSTVIPTPSLGPDQPELEVRQLDVQLGKVHELLMYVFVSNGRFYADRQKLRLSIGLPGDKRTYFSKVEVVSVIDGADDRPAARQRCMKMLDEALAELLRTHYPTAEMLE